MANTVMTAKNSFEEGLIMDLSPDNTSANSLTSALNATLITFNGNEMQLQNDMGNGRVETAYLPEGYIPVGTCEFGDIIYIVSYNPLTDKAQIGCFPSPERNISSTEISEMGQILKASDFQVMDGGGSPTGDLRSTSVKKVLIDSKKLNPGDKYIIYTNDYNSLNDNRDYLSDYGSEGKHGSTHKYVKLHVVSIDDSGKITYLDTTTKWYNIGSSGNKYYINDTKIKNGTNEQDLDEYRDLVNSNWSIFSSKHSGKLAILAELEMIDTFSCSYDLQNTTIINDGSIKYKQYDLFLNPSYTTQSVKLPYLCITKAFFNNADYPGQSKPSDSQVYYYNNNSNSSSEVSVKYPKYDASTITADPNSTITVTKNNDLIKVGTITIPYQQKVTKDDKEIWIDIESSSYIYNMEITPAMEYGRLSHLAVSLSIDFNKIGTGEITLTDWKYHNSGTTSILSYGIEAYPKPNHQIDSITMQFFDNQGFVGEYLIDDRKSYNGIFTEYFGLDGEHINPRFSKYNSETKKEESHKGNKIENIQEGTDTSNFIEGVEDGNTVYYMDDAGTLYANFLYGVKIIIKQSHINNSDAKDDDIVLYRWLWTTSMFNEYYYSVKDFSILNFELILNGEVLYESVPSTFIWRSKEINNLGNSFSETEMTHFNTYSANVQYIGKEPKGSLQSNINMYVRAGLQNDYGCFNLFKDKLSDINLDVYLSTGKINYTLDGESYHFSDKEANITDSQFLRIENIIKTDGQGTDGFKYLEGTDINQKLTDTNTIKDDFNITFSGSYNSNAPEIEDDEGNKTKCQIKNITLADCYFSNQNDKKGIPLTLAATLFNKAYTQNMYTGTIQAPVYMPIINSIEDMKSLGITYLNKTDHPEQVYFGFNTGMNLSQKGKVFGAANFILDSDSLQFISATRDDQAEGKYIESEVMINTSENQDFLDTIWSDFGSNMSQFFPVYIGGYSGVSNYCVLEGNTAKQYANVQRWQPKYNLLNASSTNPVQMSKITNGTFDIGQSGNFDDISDTNATMFLGMKYKDGFTLFNTAMVDTFTDNKFNQKKKNFKTGEYENFAYQLFLILSNTYHKDRRSEDKDINIKNFVRNGDYDIDLIKNIVIHLKAKEVQHNILMHGMDFNQYVTTVEGKTGASSEELTAIKKNVTLKFLDYAHNSQLQIRVNNSPMSFLSSDVEAYILKNGVLQAAPNLNNQFYILQNGTLEVFQNKPLQFKSKEVEESIKYILGNKLKSETVSLPGALLKKSQEQDPFEQAYNYYLQQLRMQIGHEYTSSQYYLEDEAKSAMMNMLETIYNRLEPVYEIKNEEGEVISSYSKQDILNVMYQENILYTMEIKDYYGGFFDYTGNPLLCIMRNRTDQYGSDFYIIQANTSAGQLKSHIETQQYYEIDQYLDFNVHFKYNNKLELNTATSHDNFGIEGTLDYNYGYCGFLEDIVLDRNHQVL